MPVISYWTSWTFWSLFHVISIPFCLGSMFFNSVCIQLVKQIGFPISFWFDIKQGVHQGGVFSNRLYKVYIDSLLTEFSSDGIPVWMYGIQCHYIMSADDLTLISLFVAHMLHNLSIVFRHSRKWRYRHKACKSLFLAQGRTANTNAVVYLGEDQILSLVYTLEYQQVATPNGQIRELLKEREQLLPCRHQPHLVLLSIPVSLVSFSGLLQSLVCYMV